MCIQDDMDTLEKRFEGYIVVGIGFAMILVFWIVVLRLYKTAYKSFKEWDVDTVTAADFTVEYVVTRKIWQKFNELPESSVYPSKVVSFENFLKKQIEKIIKNEPAVLT